MSILYSEVVKSPRLRSRVEGEGDSAVKSPTSDINNIYSANSRKTDRM